MIFLSVSGEKRSALLAEVARLREERNSESGEAAGDDREYVSQQPCRGTVGITNIQLPLKVEFVCSSHSRTGMFDVFCLKQICVTSIKTFYFKTQSIIKTNVAAVIHLRTDLFLCTIRSTKSLLFRPDPVWALQHHCHPAGHSCWCSERRHHLLPNFCHSVSCSLLAGLWFIHLMDITGQSVETGFRTVFMFWLWNVTVSIWVFQ